MVKKNKLFQGIIEAVRQRGYRITKSRKAIIDILEQAARPIIAAEISDKLLKLKLKTNRSTVYRELCFLTKNKFVQKIQLADHKMYYEIPTEHHHHLICTECKVVKKITLGNHLKKQEALIGKKEKFRFVSHSLEFYGVCKKCA